jgi:hypothetical protein
MAEIIRHCPDCGLDRPFDQLHSEIGWCPRSSDQYCPEWYCLACGAMLLMGEIPVAVEPLISVGIRDRVA